MKLLTAVAPAARLTSRVLIALILLAGLTAGLWTLLLSGAV